MNVNSPVVTEIHNLLISLMLRTNYVIRVMRIKDKGDKDNF